MEFFRAASRSCIRYHILGLEGSHISVARSVVKSHVLDAESDHCLASAGNGESVPRGSIAERTYEERTKVLPRSRDANWLIRFSIILSNMLPASY